MKPRYKRAFGIFLVAGTLPVVGMASPEEPSSLPGGLESDVSASMGSSEDTFNHLVETLSESFVDHYAAAERTPDGGHFGTISFAGTPPEEAFSIIRSTGLDVRVDTEAVASEEAVVSIQEEVYYSLVGNGETEAIATVDAVTGTVNVVVDEQADTSLVELKELAELSLEDKSVATINGQELESVPRRSAGASTEPVINVEIVRGEVDAAPEVIRGGARLTLCTSGYTVYYSGTPGLLTAAHRPVNSTYEGRNVISNRTIGNAGIDAAVYRRLGETAVPRFYVSSSTTRAVTGTANPAVGASTCKYGQTTSYGCTTVHSRNVCAFGYCNMTATRGYITSGGDSGGPWFLNNTAHGTHSGMATVGGAQRSVFTPIQQARASMPISVMTQ